MQGEILHVFLFGRPGSGKDNQTDLILARARVKTSTIVMSRELHNADLTPEERDMIKNDILLPDDRVVTIWGQAIERELATGARIIVHNGTLRRPGQAEAMLRYVRRLGPHHRIVLIEIDVPEEVCLERIAGRALKDQAEKGQSRHGDDPTIARGRMRIYDDHIVAIYRVTRSLGLIVTLVQNDGSPEKTIDWTFNELLRQVPALNQLIRTNHQHRPWQYEKLPPPAIQRDWMNETRKRRRKTVA